MSIELEQLKAEIAKLRAELDTARWTMTDAVDALERDHGLDDTYHAPLMILRTNAAAIHHVLEA